MAITTAWALMRCFPVWTLSISNLIAWFKGDHVPSTRLLVYMCLDSIFDPYPQTITHHQLPTCSLPRSSCSQLLSRCPQASNPPTLRSLTLPQYSTLPRRSTKSSPRKIYTPIQSLLSSTNAILPMLSWTYFGSRLRLLKNSAKATTD